MAVFSCQNDHYSSSKNSSSNKFSKKKINKMKKFDLILNVSLLKITVQNKKVKIYKSFI